MNGICRRLVSCYLKRGKIRVCMVNSLEEWPWSSDLAMIGEVRVLSWLDVDWLLGQFGRQRKQAKQAYRRFVMEEHGLPGPLDQAQHQ